MWSVSKGNSTKSSLYTLRNENNKIIRERRFLRQDLLKIDKDKLIKDLDENEFVVEKVLGKRVVNGKTQYLIQWLNYAKPTWEPFDPSYQKAIREWASKSVSQ